MAFVYRAERKCNEEINDGASSSIGPGSYDVSNKHPLLSDSISAYAHPPFNSSCPREKNSFIPTTADTSSTPGPGAYEHQHTMHNNNKLLSSLISSSTNTNLPPLNIYTAVERNVLPPSIINALRNNEVAFNSKSQRFLSTSTTYQPGPGTYTLPTDFDIISNKNKPKQKLRINDCSTTHSVNRVLSIPYKEGFGYECNANNQMVMMSDPDNEIKTTGEKDDTVGPGKYEVNISWDKHSLPWKRMSAKSTNIVKEKNDKVIPCSNDNDIQISLRSNKINKKQPTFNKQYFIEAFMNQRYQLNNTVQLTKMKQFNPLFDVESTPGPGYYAKDIDQFDTALIDKRNQNKHSFNSSEPRFKTAKSAENVVDEDNDNTSQQPKKLLANHKFKRVRKTNITNGIQCTKSQTGPTGLDIFMNKINNETALGPGAYNITKPFIKAKTSSIDSFGTKEQRFIKGGILSLGTQLETPGPGSYIGNEEYNFALTENNNTQQQQHLTVIENTSTSKYKDITNDNKFQTPAVGQYNLAIAKSILYKIRSSINPFQDTKKVSFNTQAKRFDNNNNASSIINTHTNPSLGPGVYYKEPLPNIKQNSAPFNIANKRFIYKDASIQPGPGTYEHDSFNNWNIKSHNVLFV